jgi:hypothetical protein
MPATFVACPKGRISLDYAVRLKYDIKSPEVVDYWLNPGKF